MLRSHIIASEYQTLSSLDNNVSGPSRDCLPACPSSSCLGSFPHTLLPTLSGCTHTWGCCMHTLEVKNKSCFEFEGRHSYGCRCHTRRRGGAGFLLLLAMGEQMLGLWMKLPLTDKSHTIGSLTFDLPWHWRVDVLVERWSLPMFLRLPLCPSSCTWGAAADALVPWT